MKDRLKQVRKAVHITQQQLADDLNLSKSAIECYEYGRNQISERTIKDICRLYNVNEEWFKTGKGNMFKPRDKVTEIADITTALMKDDDPYRQRLASLAVSLTDEQIANLKQKAFDLFRDEMIAMAKENMELKEQNEKLHNELDTIKRINMDYYRRYESTGDSQNEF